jgi:hypothetical protein
MNEFPPLSLNRLTVGQACAALFNKDWYRARVLEMADNRVRVQYIDWCVDLRRFRFDLGLFYLRGNTGWCDPVLEIRPLPSM